MYRFAKFLVCISVAILALVGLTSSGPAVGTVKGLTETECRAAFSEAEYPPQLYFLPFCDQTPQYILDKDGKTISTTVVDETTGQSYETVVTRPVASDCALDERQCFDKYCKPVRNCQANDFLQLFVTASQKGVILLPMVAMLFFIWGGYNLIMSGGNPQKVEQGKKMLLGVVLGLIITLILAWFWTNFVVFILTGSSNINGVPWWGGVPRGDVSGAKGCCTTSLGCKDALFRDQCEQFTGAAWIQGTSCSALTQCTLLQEGCCVPISRIDYGNCGVPDPLRGCDSWAGWTLVRGTSCVDEDKCDVWGCCTTDYGLCTDSNKKRCVSSGGTFYDNTDCSAVPQC